MFQWGTAASLSPGSPIKPVIFTGLFPVSGLHGSWASARSSQGCSCSISPSLHLQQLHVSAEPGFCLIRIYLEGQNRGTAQLRTCHTPASSVRAASLQLCHGEQSSLSWSPREDLRQINLVHTPKKKKNQSPGTFPCPQALKLNGKKQVAYSFLGKASLAFEQRRRSVDADRHGAGSRGSWMCSEHLCSPGAKSSLQHHCHSKS